jgi:hypothetical protein
MNWVDNCGALPLFEDLVLGGVLCGYKWSIQSLSEGAKWGEFQKSTMENCRIMTQKLGIQSPILRNLFQVGAAPVPLGIAVLGQPAAY